MGWHQDKPPKNKILTAWLKSLDYLPRKINAQRQAYARPRQLCGRRGYPRMRFFDNLFRHISP